MHAVDTEEWVCSCKGFQCLGYCWHIIAVRGLEREREKRVP